MKRSRVVSLVLLGAAGATAYGLATWTGASSDQTDAEVFTTAGDCAARGHDAATCAGAFETASMRNAADAPRFEARADCERDFGAGQCNTTSVRRPDGSIATYFVPAMIGYALARSLSGQGGPTVAQPLYSCPPERRRPDGTCYRTSSGYSFYSGYSGSWSSGASGSRPAAAAQRVPAAVFERPAAGTAVVRSGGSVGTVTRGGFGSTGHAVASASSGGS